MLHEIMTWVWILVGVASLLFVVAAGVSLLKGASRPTPAPPRTTTPPSPGDLLGAGLDTLAAQMAYEMARQDEEALRLALGWRNLSEEPTTVRVPHITNPGNLASSSPPRTQGLRPSPGVSPWAELGHVASCSMCQAQPARLLSLSKTLARVAEDLDEPDSTSTSVNVDMSSSAGPGQVDVRSPFSGFNRPLCYCHTALENWRKPGRPNYWTWKCSEHGIVEAQVLEVTR